MNSTSRKRTLSDATASEMPHTKATKSRESGIASHSVARTRDSTIKLRTRSNASIAANESRWEKTTNSGTSCRATRVLRIRFALSSIELDDDCTAAAKNVQSASP